MIEKAIARITKEMMEMDDPLAQLIEEHLTENCNSEGTAAKLLDPKKTLKEVHKQIWDEARKRKKGNGAFIPDQEIYSMVDEYYGIGAAGPQTQSINVLDLI